MPRKLLIIQPSHYRSETCREIVKVRRRQLVPLTLAYLAALTPSDWEVKLVDELVEDVDFDSPADVVALTLWTANSLRGYDVAAAFRARGVPVILGGAHTFFHAEEAARHGDAVGVGEGEVIWPQMLADAARAAGKASSVARDQRRDSGNVACPPFLQRQPDTSKIVTGVAASSPAISRRQVVGKSSPSGVTAPRPVTTMRWVCGTEAGMSELATDCATSRAQFRFDRWAYSG
jgi:hypothetical protein